MGIKQRIVAVVVMVDHKFKGVLFFIIILNAAFKKFFSTLVLVWAPGGNLIKYIVS